MPDVRRRLAATALAAILAGGIFAPPAHATAPSDASTAPRGTGTAPRGTGGGPLGHARHTTDVDVLYAASLTEVMETKIGPAFDKATGYHFVGFPGGSKSLATQIRSHLQAADVFISASPAVDKTLEGRINGNWVSAYTVFGRTYLELGYDRTSKFAGQLRSKPWYEVVVEPGFRLGRTDPAVDPKGVLAQKVLDEAAAQHHLPALKSLAETASDVFPEESLVGRLQAGQLDAGFFYQVEVVAAHLPSVPLTGYRFAATYTYAVVNRALHRNGARAFVRFLTEPGTRATLARDGLGSAG